MHQALKIGWAVALGFALAAPAVYAQVKEEPPPPSIEDNQKYVSQGPAKCVEVGNYYLRRNKVEAALSRFQEAFRVNPHYAPAYLGLGKVYERMGLKQKALEAYKHYLDELPSAKDAAEAKDAQRAMARLQREVGPRDSPAKTNPPR
ncbi:MAG: tetratricopeptide repeat protein [Terriglobia bacterium]|jgi:tetratricopeptide (TPR) repeat protein